ncbi:hypothetical protein [Gordonia sp. (in: high G+C Gram-positive bacteria)]|uniref:hypothetical protein n=1 Tax=Gordonia sp. (in: high G+C Gram-positive bacteria) TaxID=84139 RepID=UPI00333F69D2
MDATVAIVVLVIALATPIVLFGFYCYLLMNRRTRAYFSPQSVEIRRRARAEGRTR